MYTKRYQTRTKEIVVMLMWLLFLILLLVLGVGFLWSYKANKMSLAPSSFLLLFLNVLLLGYLYVIYWLTFEQEVAIARIFLLIGLIPYVLITVFGSYVLIMTLVYNTRVVFKRESRSLAHALPLILAIGLVIYWVARSITDVLDLPLYLQVWIYALYGIIGLHLFKFVRYIVATILLLMTEPKLNQDYIIVHGSGLINGNVPPLLGGRIDKAIAFYERQKDVGQPPKLILSGGQGSDEPRPEAVAMAEYAQQKGIPSSDLLLEDKSTTTFENMTFSKKIMDADSKGEPYNCIFSTSNYHVFRTGIYAKIAGLNIDGIGSKTALYYLPNALIREYIAYIVMYKRRQLKLVGIVFLMTGLLSFVLYVNR